MNDTAPEIAKFVREQLMARSGEERFMMASRSFDAARELVMASFPPGLPPNEVRRRLFKVFYGHEIKLTEEEIQKLWP